METKKRVTRHHKWELQAWPAIKPHRSDLIASLLQMAGVLERIRTSQAISLSLRRQRMKSDAIGPHER
jgi:hypothetical protein